MSGTVPTRTLGPFSVSAIGLGCMNLSHAYGTPPDAATGARLLNEAVDMGYTLLDTAALYGFGRNEALVGEALAGRREEIVLASKCGMAANADGKREINGRPEVLKKTCEDALKRLRTDVIDLYYLHRWDKSVPIEDSVGALADLVAEGKVRAIGLSEVSAATLRKAHAVHPVTALQTEYSLWTRNPEIAVLDACRDLGVAFVAFSPLGRGFLTGALRDVTALGDKDIRKAMPRFAPEAYARNLRLLDPLAEIAAEVGCSLAQLSLAWLLAKGGDIIPIPGTTRSDRLRENLAAAEIRLDPGVVARLDEVVNQRTVVGARYNAATQAEIDTEDFTG
ncbi:aldo/keto reductase [Novispirillum sp. DQ9]|uniref:aldo/keto reductase n=1 Tax=Novispirillum sp. DQ9 TaxID=3398612 RepID=UPI003C7AB76A